MKRYFPFFAQYKKALIFGPLLAVVDVCSEIVQPKLMSHIVDQGIQHKDINYILKMGALMVCLSLLAIAAGVGNIWFSSRASVGFATNLRKGVFHKIQQFSFANIDRFSTASLVTRLTNDITTLQQVIMMSLRLLIRAPLMLICAVLLAVSINAQLTLVIAIAIPVLATSIFLILRKGVPYFTRMQQKLDHVNGAIQENLTNIRLVKSFVRFVFEEKKFATANNDLRDISIRASGIVILIMPVMMLVMNISIVAIMWLGGERIMNGTFKVGELMSFIGYITQILLALMLLSMTIMTFSRAGASSKRILEVLNTEVDIKDPEPGTVKNKTITNGKVEFRDVDFKYDVHAREYVLKDISFTAMPGEIIGIVGATGSAKSTLVQLMPRLYEVSQGQVFIDDTDVRDYPLQHLRSSVSMVLQKNLLFSGTIRENLKWGNQQATEEEMIVAAKAAQAHEFITSFPKQYDTWLEQGGVNLSGGQQQRICIARAILKRPAILILDDSTSAVDSDTEAKIRIALEKEHGAATTFIIAQRISSIRNVDRILVLDDGRIIGSGTHDELMQSNEVYKEIYTSQMQNDNITA